MHVRQHDAPCEEIVLHLVHPHAQALERGEVRYLRADVEMHPHQLHVPQRGQQGHHRVQVGQVDAEFVLVKPRGDVVVRVGVHVGVEAQGHPRRAVLAGGQRVDDLQLGHGLHVEAENVVVQRQVDFPVGLAHPGKDDALRRDARVDGRLYLAAAHAVGPEAGPPHLAQDGRVHVRLQRVMHAEVRLARLPPHLVHGGTQHVHVIIVKRSLQLPELVEREISFQHNV